MAGVPRRIRQQDWSRRRSWRPWVDVEPDSVHATLSAPRRRALVVCPGDPARAQMAAGLLETVAGELVDVVCAATRPAEVDPLACTVMVEAGVDLRAQRPRPASEVREEHFDFLFAIYDGRHEDAPLVADAAERYLWDCPNPAAARGSTPERLARFRAARDAIAIRMNDWAEQIA